MVRIDNEELTIEIINLDLNNFNCGNRKAEERQRPMANATPRELEPRWRVHQSDQQSNEIILKN